MTQHPQPPLTADETMLGSIGLSISDYQRIIGRLLNHRSITLSNVQRALDQKARTKTPFNDKQLRLFSEFTGLCAREGGRLKDSLLCVAHYRIHTENTEPLWQSLLQLQASQRSAIISLRRIIASGERLLETL